MTGRSTGHPVRGLKNKLSKEFEELEKRGASVEELEKLGTGKLRLAVVEGDTKWGSLMAGQSAGLVRKIEPAAAIIEDIINGAAAEIERLKRFAD